MCDASANVIDDLYTYTNVHLPLMSHFSTTTKRNFIFIFNCKNVISYQTRKVINAVVSLNKILNRLLAIKKKLFV